MWQLQYIVGKICWMKSGGERDRETEKERQRERERDRDDAMKKVELQKKT